MRTMLYHVSGLAIVATLTISSAAHATTFAEGVVDVAGPDPVTVWWNPLDDLPLDRKIYLRVDGGELVSATWAFMFEHQHLWWEYGEMYGEPWGPYLSGDEFEYSDWVVDNQVFDSQLGHSELHYIVRSTLDPRRATVVAHDLSSYYSDCADPFARPPGADCSTTPFRRFLGLDQFVVQPTAASVSWTLSVPEPAAWALMLTGFGMMGAALRRRRAAIAQDAALSDHSPSLNGENASSSHSIS